MEILSPAGSPEAVRAAVCAGANAVYLGYGAFNARRNARNFTEEEVAEAVSYCHLRGVKVYVTLNTLVGDREMAAAAEHAVCSCDGIPMEAVFCSIVLPRDRKCASVSGEVWEVVTAPFDRKSRCSYALIGYMCIMTKNCSDSINHILPVLFRLCNRKKEKKIKKNTKMGKGIKTGTSCPGFCLFLPVRVRRGGYKGLKVSVASGKFSRA